MPNGTTMERMQLALLTTAQMAAADRMTIAQGTAGIVLMERAGLAVADAAVRLSGIPSSGATVAVVCGPGNNGGDGFVAARILRERGLAVRLSAIGEPAGLTGDAAEAFARWGGTPMPIGEAMVEQPSCVVDAMFGAGLSRPLEGQAAAAAELINASGRPVLSVDVPSGLNGDSGQAAGPVVRADETVTFFRMKPGHLLMPGRDLCGTITLADIGISDRVLDSISPLAFRNGPELWKHAWPSHGRDAHKFARGAVAVVAGGISGVGAPRLGARASLRIGAGLVTIHCDPSALAAHASRGPDALMQRPLADLDGLHKVLEDPRLKVVLAGPALGLDARAHQFVSALSESPGAVVFDADALTLLAASPALLAAAGAQGSRVLTPHEGEFKRLFGAQAAVMDKPSKLERAIAAASSSRAVIVYKGADTVIAAPDGRAAINTTGSPALATAGSGDVLGGMIAGLMAQGMPAFEAASAAVWLHGRVGEAIGFGLIADDLPDAIPVLLRDTGLEMVSDR
ncbi:NAD(P)H-hydrate dehydratase [Bosea sp. (in: a-proteobacteria)]|uniref:NAD(P)H-hydrate dehydratase n=1 Tax=Bosea sp. (in: a-proteobacteria) TaxID=1871050 RepID=UPI0025B9EE2B|nr:NAD(P)H-hydrate dehydratase [Bosea sp. (in: a-proteobacteria)]